MTREIRIGSAHSILNHESGEWNWNRFGRPLKKRKDHHDLRKRLYLECWWRLEFSTKKLFYKAMRCWPVVLLSVNIKYLQCGSKFCIQMCHDVIDWIQGICVLALYWWIYPSSYLIQLDFFSFSYAILVQCLLMNKDTFILGPSNQSLRLARQDKGGFSQIWHGLACSASVKEGLGCTKWTIIKAHLLGLQYPRDILSTCTFHHQQYFIIFSFLVQEMQKHNIRKLWCRKIMVLH